MHDAMTAAEMREALGETQRAFLAIVDAADERTLHHVPAEGAWSLAEVLAHMSEARRFFAREALRVRLAPGSRMGRTIQDAGRIEHVRVHGGDDAATLREALTSSHGEVMAALDTLSDTDLAVAGEHVNPKFGRQTIGEFLHHFLVDHERKHVEQSRRCVASAASGAQAR
jgi:uncharacterized damage-inducible protein DinB